MNNARQVDIMRLAHGKWRSVLLEQGISENVLDGKHHPCPLCGGKDRFRFINKEGDGWWICNQCGSGDGMEMYMALTRQDFGSASDELRGKLCSYISEPPPQINPNKRRDNMKYNAALWKSAKRDHPLLEEYLTGRGLMLDEWRGVDLAVNPSVDFISESDEKSKVPAMLARVSTRDGKLALIHRTYLFKLDDGRFVPKKKMTSPSRDWKGGCVRLFPTKDQSQLIIAEGIETALSLRAIIYRKHGLLVPCWAAVNANALERMAVPDHIKTVLIGADNDSSYTGQKVAYALANRLTVSDGKKVKVVTPENTDTDWNDEVRNG